MANSTILATSALASSASAVVSVGSAQDSPVAQSFLKANIKQVAAGEFQFVMADFAYIFSTTVGFISAVACLYSAFSAYRAWRKKCNGRQINSQSSAID